MQSRLAVAVAVCFLGLPGIASAAVITVDDDATECPSASFSSIQAGVDAAAAGDTVAICQGTYTEGPGGPGTNGLSITKPITLYGAGAGLVTIQPSAANGGTIADPGSNTPATTAALLRNGTGNVIDVSAGPTIITGVRVRSNGVETEAGIAFRNADGFFRNGQVTDLWNNAQFPRVTGVGVLGVTDDGQPHTVSIRRSIVQGYNIAGVLLDANAAGTGSALTGLIDQTRVQGAGPQDEQEQDGIRLEDGAAATVTNADVDSNFFKPNQARSAGVRLVGGGVAGTDLSGNNIQGNGYGVMNMDASDTSVAPGPGQVDARSTWWGDTDGPCPQAGPSPPAQPSCPTTGDPVTSDSVDFSGWFTDPVISPQTWGTETDANPSVKITAPSDGATLPRNVATAVQATAQDDMAIQSVTFMKGTTVLGVDTAAPYEASYTPTDAEGGTSQVIVAIARDPLGHRGTDQISVRIAAPNPPQPAPEEPDEPPTVSITAPERGEFVEPRQGTTIRARATDDNAVRSVAFLIKGKRVCLDRSAPYTCRFRPTARHVGRDGVVAVAADGAGQTAQDHRHVVVQRFTPPGLSLDVTPSNDPSPPFTWVTSGRLRLPDGLSRRAACRTRGYVTIQFQVGRTTFDTVRKRIKRDCTYSRRTAFRIRQRLLGRGRVRVVARFLGNDVLRRVTSRPKFTSAG
jgi:hypothetical protein